MIELFKLVRLPHTQKIRKIIKIIETLETECVACSSDLPYSATPLSCDSFYIEGLCTHLASMYPSDSVITAAVKTYMSALRAETLTAGDYRILFNALRHALYRQSGVQPSEWDLIAPGLRYGTDAPKHDTTAPNPAVSDTETQIAAPSAVLPITRPFYPGVYVYAEDIRAPFNLGSIFRTAEAFGAEKLLLSEGCVSPEQPRAQRSAMGCTHFLPWEYCSLESLPADSPVFALETSDYLFFFPQAWHRPARLRRTGTQRGSSQKGFRRYCQHSDERHQSLAQCRGGIRHSHAILDSLFKRHGA